jgi:hypothetical protein
VVSYEYLEKTKGGKALNPNLLKGELVKHGMTQGDMSRKLSLSLSRFNAKLNGTRGAEFTLSEIRGIMGVLGLSKEDAAEIFLS